MTTWRDQLDYLLTLPHLPTWELEFLARLDDGRKRGTIPTEREGERLRDIYDAEMREECQ